KFHRYLRTALDCRGGTCRGKVRLRLKAIYAGRVRPQQLLVTGEMPLVIASATGTMTSHIVGVKDHVLVATITSKTGTSLFSKGKIKSVEALKGKPWPQAGLGRSWMRRYVTCCAVSLDLFPTAT